MKAISEKFEIQDEDQAALLLRGLRKHLGEDLDKDVEPHKIKDDAFWEAITAFFFEERLAVLHVLAHVLRTGELALLDMLQACLHTEVPGHTL